METRILKQVKMVEIKQPQYYVDGGMGFSGNWVKEHIYYKDIYTTKEKVQEEFEKAKELWEKEKENRYGASGVEVEINEFWKTVEIIEGKI